DPEPEEREARLGEDRPPDVDHRDDDQEGDHVREDVPPDDAGVGGPNGPRRGHVLTFSQAESLAAREAADAGPSQEPEEDRQDQPGPEREQDGDRNEQIEARDAVQRADQPDDHVVPPATEIAGREADDDPDRHQNEGREEADEERDAAAVEQADDLGAP